VSWLCLVLVCDSGVQSASLYSHHPCESVNSHRTPTPGLGRHRVVTLTILETRWEVLTLKRGGETVRGPL